MGKMTEAPCLNVIYDNRHSEDYGRLLGEFIQQGITKFMFWEAKVFSDSVVRSISASHKMVVQWAKDNNMESVTIGEQDLMFTDKDAWEYYLKQMPNEFDIYLGCTYIPPISNSKLCGFHLYTVHKNYYDKFLSVDENKHIDTAVSDLGGDFKFCYPFPALQRSGYSANNKAVVDYNKILSEKDIYRG